MAKLFEVKFLNAPTTVLFKESEKAVRNTIKGMRFQKGFKPKIKSIMEV